MAAHANLKIIMILLLSFSLTSVAEVSSRCVSESTRLDCHDNAEALKLKLIAITSILAASMAGVLLPLFSRSIPALQPEGNLFSLVKAFASGVILATGYMHVLPDSFDDLTSDCLPENPWRKFPFTTFVAMLSALITLMVDSFMLSLYKKRCHFAKGNNERVENGNEESVKRGEIKIDGSGSQLLRHRIIAQVLEMGIVVHSVVIGLAMGASDNHCSIRPLIAALCFHQFFEGMGLGGCILQANYEAKMKFAMVFFFSVTTPLGIALGIGLSNVYSETSPTALIVVGLLNACSAGLLNYMALVDLLAADFLGPRLQENVKLQLWSYVAVLLGAGGMSLMAKWA